MQAVIVLLANCPRRNGWVGENVIAIYKIRDATLRALQRRGVIEDTLGLTSGGAFLCLWRLTPLFRAVIKAART